MTYKGAIQDKEIRWEDCVMDRYDTNNGIVLQYNPHRDHRSKHLFYLDGALFGLEPHHPAAVAFIPAEPIFKEMLEIHNHAFQRGLELGEARAKHQIREALGL